MQSASWYLNRLRSMSAGEVLWRIRSMVRDKADRYRIAMAWYPSSAVFPGTDLEKASEPGFRVSDVEPGAWAAPQAGDDQKRWLSRLLKQADQLAENRFSFFDLEDIFLGYPIDWHRDYGSGRQAPRVYAQTIDYRDFEETGDCKLVWEPNRHHQLVVLGRACRASGQRRYTEALAGQLETWLEQNPFGVGMNWRSPLELGIRLINWVWAVDLARDAGVLSPDLERRLLHAIYLHCWEITRKYSRGSSANNHLIGEAAGVFVATSYLPQMPGAGRWRAESRAILDEELQRQSYADGCTREQALGYQLFVLQFFLVAGIVARKGGEDFPAAYWARLERMLEFLCRLQEGGANLPKFGDADDGYVLDLGGNNQGARQLLALGAALFGRPDFKHSAGTDFEPALWLLGKEGDAALRSLSDGGGEAQLPSDDFKDSGHYLLQSGTAGSPEAISVLFDCGDLGYGAIAAHGHADALSFTVRAGGADIFVDPGTYDYFTYPEWRRYFRGTQAHNTVTIDGLDQSEMLGSFLWGKRARAVCTRWEPRRGGGIVSGSHDGYMRLPDPVGHHRIIELEGEKREITVRDEITARGLHHIDIAFHLAEDCRVEAVEGIRCTIVLPDRRRIILVLDVGLTPVVRTGSLDPPGGWVSRGYHRKTSSTTIVGSGTLTGNTTFTCQVIFGGEGC